MIVATVIIGILTILLLCWIRKRKQFVRTINTYPGPKDHPVFGEVFYLSRNLVSLFKQLRQFADEFPDGYKMWGGHLGSINILAPEDLEVILSSSKHIEKSQVYGLLEPWLKTGLLTSSGSKWQQRRKILTPAFHFNILRRFVFVFAEHSQKLVEELEFECDKVHTNILPLISKSTLDIICETAMGTSLNMEDKTHVEYRSAIYELAPVVIQRLLKPWLYNDYIYALSPSRFKERRLLNILHKFTKSVIVERERNFDESTLNILEKNDEDDEEIVYSSKKRLAMLDLLIQAKKSGNIDDEGIQEEVDTFMFEGHDTTSMAISYALMTLSHEKQAQDKIYEELSEIFGDSKRPANYKDLQEMKYLELCLKECLRLYPSVPFISRYITEEIKLKKSLMPANIAIHIHIYDVHRNKEFFPNPEKFDPDRFLPENSSGRHPYVYVPFSAGPRNCIGQRFAMLEMKCIISSILRYYVLEPVDRPEEKFMVDFVLRTKDPVNVKFRLRKK